MKSSLRSWTSRKNKRGPSWITNYTVVSQKHNNEIIKDNVNDTLKDVKVNGNDKQNEENIALKDMTTWWNGKG